MNAIDFIQENINPLAILQYYNFKDIKETETEFRACCAIHNGDNNTGFVWRKDNNLWYCYTGDCGGGDVFSLIQKIDLIGFQEAVKKAAKILELNIENMQIDASSYMEVNKEQNKWLNKQKKIYDEIHNQTNKEYEQSFTKYYEENENFSRFEKETLIHFNAKFCNLYPAENTNFRSKLVIPIYNENYQIGVALRDTTGVSFPKWLYQPQGLKISKILYNINNIDLSQEEVVLCEGIFDVWRYYEAGVKNAIAVFGSSISTHQYKVLIKLGVNITLSFDGDNAGRKATKQAIELFKNKCELKVINFEEGKDPADYTKQELLEKYLTRIPIRVE